MFKKLRMVMEAAFYNFRFWKGNARIMAVFILSFILCFLLTDKIVVFAKAHETTMQLMEAFIWTFGDSNSILLSSLLLLLLYADMPFITGATPFFLVRASRKTWVLGQLVYIILSTGIYLLFTLISTCLLCAPYSFTKNIWSQTAAILAYSEEGKALVLPASVKTLEMSRPYQSMMSIFMLMMLYVLTMVFIMMVFNIWKGTVAGVLSVLVFSSYGVLLNPEHLQKLLKLPEEFYYKARVFIGWISPLNHATYYMHNFGYDKLPTLRQTVFIFIGSIAFLTLLTMRVTKKFSFVFRGTES